MIRVRTSGSVGVSKGAVEEAARAAAVDVVRHWHEPYLPGHFTVEGGRRYAYQARKGDNEPPRLPRVLKSGRVTYRSNPHYSWQKRRQMRHNRPLVWSGRSEHLAKASVKLSSRGVRKDKEVRGTAAMPLLPKYFYQRRTDLKQPDKANELTRTVASEEQDLTQVYQREMSGNLSKARQVKAMRRIV